MFLFILIWNKGPLAQNNPELLYRHNKLPGFHKPKVLAIASDMEDKGKVKWELIQHIYPCDTMLMSLYKDFIFVLIWPTGNTRCIYSQLNSHSLFLINFHHDFIYEKNNYIWTVVYNDLTLVLIGFQNCLRIVMGSFIYMYTYDLHFIPFLQKFACFLCYRKGTKGKLFYFIYV